MSAASELARGEVRLNMPRAEYDASPRLRWTYLKEMLRSPAHYVWNMAHPKEQTDAMRLGDACHVATLEPEAFTQRFAKWVGGKRIGNEWKAFRAAHTAAGREVLTEEEWAEALAMQEAVRRHRVASKYLQGGDFEVALFWDIVAPEVPGLPGFRFECKGRMDLLSRAGAIVDLKTTRDASPWAFESQAARLGYFAQAAFYSDGYFTATGIRLPYVIIAVESSAPFATTVFTLDAAAMDFGRSQYITALSRLDACRKLDVWDAYADTEVPLNVPRWAAAQAEME